MKPGSTGLMLRLRTALSWPRGWSLAVVLMVAIQFGLLVHQSQHHLNRDARLADDCTLCQVTAAMTDGAAPPVLILPVFVLLGIVVQTTYSAPRSLRVVHSFRSRAPPRSIRI